MKIYYLLFAFTLLISLPSCDKDDDPSGGKTRLLSSLTTVTYPDTTTFEYNASKQIIRVENGEATYTLTVNGNQLHFNEYRKTENREVADATFTLNSAGNIISGQGDFSYAAHAPYTAQFTFEYDAEGHQTKRTDVRSGGMTYSYDYGWTNGDLTSIKWNLNDSLYLTQTREYDLALEDKLKIDNQKFHVIVNSFTGKLSNHLLKRSYTVFAPGTTIEQETTYVFDLDAEGYPVTRTSNGVTTPYVEVTTFHYQ